jgi:hypothetical protein
MVEDLSTNMALAHLRFEFLVSAGLHFYIGSVFADLNGSVVVNFDRYAHRYLLLFDTELRSILDFGYLFLPLPTF